MNIKNIQKQNLEELLAKLNQMEAIQDKPELCAVVQGYVNALWLMRFIPRDSDTIELVIRAVNRNAYFSSGIESYIIPDDTPSEISRQDLAKLSVESTMQFNEEADADEVFTPLELFAFFGHVSALHRMGALHSDIANKAVAYIAVQVGDIFEKARPQRTLNGLVITFSPELLNTKLKIDS